MYTTVVIERLLQWCVFTHRSRGANGPNAAVRLNGDASNHVYQFPYPKSDYAQGVLTDARVALPAADEPAVDGAPRRRTGVVRMWNVDKGFGFVQESDGTDLFVHVRSLVTHSSSAALEN